MPLEIRYRDAYLICILLAMLTPLGISLWAFIRAAQAESVPLIVPLADAIHVESPLGHICTGGTVMVYRSIWTVVDGDHATRRPYVRPRPPESS